MYRHPTDYLSLVFGLAFTSAAVTVVLYLADVVDESNAGIVVPLVLIVIGTVGLIATLVGSHRASREPETADNTTTDQVPVLDP